MARQQRDANWYSRVNRLWLIIAAIIVAVIILAAFMSRRREVPVRAARVERQTLTATIQTNGKIEPINSFEAHAPAATTVKRVLVHEGEHVKSGQLLLQLEDVDARAQAAKAQSQIRAAQATLSAIHHGGTREEVLSTESQLTRARADRDAAQRNLQAMRALQQRGAASAGEVADAENRLKTAQAQVSMLEQKLSSRYSQPEIAQAQAQASEAEASYAAAEDLLRQSNIRAPRSGMVYSLPVHAGMFVNTGDLLVAVADLSQVQLRAFVDEPDIGKLAPEEPVRVSWEALPGRTWDGKVTQVPTTVVTRNSRSVGEFTCTVANPDEKLLPNINVNVSIVTASDENALTVPREAVHETDGRRFVYAIVNGELQQRSVDTSISNLTRIQITQGLSDNALVALAAVSGQPLRPGMPVRVVQE